METTDKIMAIIDQQVTGIAKLSKKGQLSQSEVVLLQALADTLVKVLDKVKVAKKKVRPKGFNISDEDLTKYAKGK